MDKPIEITREEFDSWLEYSEDNVVADGEELEPETSKPETFSDIVWDLPTERSSLFVSKEQWGHAYGVSLVGQNRRTNSDCGRFVKMVGCLDTGAHNFTDLRGVNHRGNASLYPIFHYCDKSTCEICYRQGFARREAKNIAARLEFAAKEFRKAGLDVGRIEHGTISLSAEDSDALRFAVDRKAAVSEARKKAWSYGLARGLAGATLVLHCFRYANFEESKRKGVLFGWRFSPHFHFLGFVYGGYRCRKCPNNNEFSRDKCLVCAGYEGRTRREYAKDKTIVKIFGERKTINGSAFYQLNHASVVDGVKRFHVASWHGICSYRAMHFKPENLRRSVWFRVSFVVLR